MRQMTDGDTTVDVLQHIITANMWEHYILEQPDEHGIVFALVVGDYTELGDVSLPEIMPYALSMTQEIDSILPAPGWSWV